MSEPIELYFPDGIPEKFQKVFMENYKAVEKLFPTAEVTSQSSNDLLHFLGVLTDIFTYSQKIHETNPIVTSGYSPMLEKCVKKYREIFRHGFRGVLYLTTGRFVEIADGAEVEAYKKWCSFSESCGVTVLQAQEKENELGKLISLERSWITQVNEQRREENLSMITAETTQKFKDIVESDFGYLYPDEDLQVESSNMLIYCEESKLQESLEKTVAYAKDYFKKQIPFEEDETILAELCIELENELKEKVIDDLKRRNCVQREVVQGRMKTMIELSVELYTEAMTKCLGEEIVRPNEHEVLENHEKMKNEFMPMFVEKETETEGRSAIVEIGTHEHQVYCWNLYNDMVYEIFAKLMTEAIQKGRLKLDVLRTETGQEIENSFQNIEKILEVHSLVIVCDELRSNVNKNLEQVFTSIQVENDRISENVVREAKPIRLLTEQETLVLGQCEKVQPNEVVIQVEKVDSGTNTDESRKRLRDYVSNLIQRVQRFWRSFLSNL